MSATLETSADRRDDGTPSESHVNLQRAVRTLRAIRERYEMGRKIDSPYMRGYSVQVALGYADMLWITAAIEAFEKTIPAGVTEP